MAKNETPATNWRSEAAASVLRIRPRLLLSAALLVAAGIGARYVWNHLSGTLGQSPRYQITAEVIQLPGPLPAWIRTDVKRDVLLNSDITRSLSLLDKPQKIQRRLIDAFALHPWVRSVRRIELCGPSRIEVELEYREPVAVAQVVTGNATELLPVDDQAFRLPEGNLTEVEKSYLPRIANIDGRPLVGEPWTDKRLIGGVAIAVRLRDVWDQFRLLEIVPSSYPEVERSHRYFTYDIRSSSGTLIRWGAAPELGPPGESSFDQKLARLQGYVGEHGPLDSIRTPQAIDVRDGLMIEKRTVQRESSDQIVR